MCGCEVTPDRNALDVVGATIQGGIIVTAIIQCTPANDSGVANGGETEEG